MRRYFFAAVVPALNGGTVAALLDATAPGSQRRCDCPFRALDLGRSAVAGRTNALGRHRYSAPILQVGLIAAWEEIAFSRSRFEGRGGVYDWR